MLSAAAVGERLGLGLAFAFARRERVLEPGRVVFLAPEPVRERFTAFDPLDFVPAGLRFVVLATLSLLQES